MTRDAGAFLFVSEIAMLSRRLSDLLANRAFKEPAHFP